HVLVEDVVDLPRLGQVLDVEARRGGELLVDDLVAEIDALVADVDARAGDQLLDLALRLSAEAAEKLLVGIRRSGQLAVPPTTVRVGATSVKVAPISLSPARASAPRSPGR